MSSGWSLLFCTTIRTRALGSSLFFCWCLLFCIGCKNYTDMFCHCFALFIVAHTVLFAFIKTTFQKWSVCARNLASKQQHVISPQGCLPYSRDFMNTRTNRHYDWAYFNCYSAQLTIIIRVGWWPENIEFH